MPPELTLRLALTAVYSLVVLGLTVTIPVLVWRARPLPAGTLRDGALLAALVLALQLPGIATYALYYDPRALLEDELAPPLLEMLAPDLIDAMVGASVVSAVVLAAWRVLVWAAAGAAHPREAFPWLRGGEPRPWGSAVALGIGLGLVGVTLDVGFGAPEGIAREASNLFPGLPSSWPTRLALGATGGLAAAFAEELLFRGVLQRLLLRWLPVGAAVTLGAVVVACGHALTPELPWLAMVRAGAMAGVLGAWSYRHGLECSLVAHGVLALVVAAGTLLA